MVDSYPSLWNHGPKYILPSGGQGLLFFSLLFFSLIFSSLLFFSNVETESLPMQHVKAHTLLLTALHEVTAPAVAKPALLLRLGGDVDQVPLSLYKLAPASMAFLLNRYSDFSNSMQHIRWHVLPFLDVYEAIPCCAVCSHAV